MTADLKAAVEACPDQKIVLLGYSQGGKFFFSYERQGAVSEKWADRK
jgi:hypothetical protein